MTLDPRILEAIRLDTPASCHRVHLDNAGSSLMPKPVAETLMSHLQHELAKGGYVAAEDAAERHAAAYGTLARLLGARDDEIALQPSATEAWGRLFYSLPLEPGDRVITAFNEYCANFVSMLHRARRDGIAIDVIDPAADGDPDLDALQARIGPRTRLIAISHVPSSSGQINPVAAVGAIARSAGVPFLLDACQSVGQLPVDVDAIGCDMLTGTARKFLRGPRGVGFLYVRREMLERLDPVMLTNQAAEWTASRAYRLRDDARVFEAWESNVAGELALAAAVDYLLDLGVDAVSERALTLAAAVRDGLAAIDGVTVRDPGRTLSAIVSFTAAGRDAAWIKAELARHDIAVQVASVTHTRLDLEARGIDTAVRVSPHYYNTEAEIDRFLTVLGDLLAV